MFTLLSQTLTACRAMYAALNASFNPLISLRYNLLLGVSIVLGVVKVKEPITSVSGATSIRNSCRMRTSATFISINANRMPKQFRGPCPKGNQANGWCLDLLSLLNLKKKKIRQNQNFGLEIFTYSRVMRSVYLPGNIFVGICLEMEIYTIL